MPDESITRTIIGAVAGAVGVTVGAWFRWLGDRGTQQLIVDQGKRITGLEESLRLIAVAHAECRKENELFRRWIKYLRDKVTKLEKKIEDAKL